MKKVQQMKKRMWKPEEDMILKTYVEIHGEGNWSAVSKKLGLRRGGKSCRLRWKNYLRPDIKHGSMSKDEEDLIIRMHKLIGNRWALIAGRLPGRTDNEVKNYWNTYLSKKAAKQRPRGKPQLDENDTKQAEIGSNEDVGANQLQEEVVKETNTNMAYAAAVQEEDHHVLDEEYWSSSIAAADFMMDGGNQFMMFGGELDGQEVWDRGGCDLFDTFGFNWEDTHALFPIDRHGS